MKALLFSPQRVCVFVTLCLLGCLTWSCKKDDVSARVNGDALFTLQVNKIVDKPDVYYQTPGQNKYYVVVGDASGKLIDYKQLTPQTTFTFTKPEGFTDTELTISYVSYSPKYGYFIQSSRNIPVGESWVATHLDADATQSPIPQEYQLKVRVSNIPGSAKGLTSLNDYITRSGLQTNTDYIVKTNKSSGNNLWFRLDYTNQPPRFFLLSNATANQSYTLDLSKFENGIAKSMKIAKPVPVNWAAVTGTSTTSSSSLFVLQNEPEIGTVANTPLIDKIDFYIPGEAFTKINIYASIYQSSLSNTNNAQSYLYGNFESVPDTLPLIKADFTVTKNADNSFSMSTSGAYTMYRINGRIDRTPQNTSVNWSVAGKAQTNVSFLYPEIPTALIPVSSNGIKGNEVELSMYSYLNSYEEYFTRSVTPEPKGYFSRMSHSIQ